MSFFPQFFGTVLYPFLGWDLTQYCLMCKELKFTVPFCTRIAAGNSGCTVLHATSKMARIDLHVNWRKLHRFACDSKNVHRLARNLQKVRAPFCVQLNLACTVLRAVSNVMHRFVCRIEKVCTILRAALLKSVHRFACSFAEKRAPFCVQSRYVHRFACRLS